MVKKIKKADTFGQKKEWQIDPKIRKEIIKKSIEMEVFADFCEESIDDLLVILCKLGYAELEKL
jgi:hypothetical protein